MKRRQFLKAALLTLVAAYAPISLKKEPTRQIPTTDELTWAPDVWEAGIWKGMEGANVEIVDRHTLVLSGELLTEWRIAKVEQEHKTLTLVKVTGLGKAITSGEENGRQVLRDSGGRS